MTDQHKNDANKASSNERSGSDTASAAKISAGTSVGNVGQSPMPGGSQGAQSATLASHTSSPLGGQPTAKTHGKSSQQGDPQAGQAGRGSGGGSRNASGQDSQSGGMMDQAGEVYEQATEWARGAYDSASSWASDAMDSGSRYTARARRSMPDMRMGAVQRYAAENPVMVGIVGLAAGLLIGALLPRTRRENELFGEWSDEVRQQGLRYAHEMAQHGREFVEENFSGDDPRFAHHDSEFRGGQSGANRH